MWKALFNRLMLNIRDELSRRAQARIDTLRWKRARAGAHEYAVFDAEICVQERVLAVVGREYEAGAMASSAAIDGLDRVHNMLAHGYAEHERLSRELRSKRGGGGGGAYEEERELNALISRISEAHRALDAAKVAAGLRAW